MVGALTGLTLLALFKGLSAKNPASGPYWHYALPWIVGGLASLVRPSPPTFAFAGALGALTTVGALVGGPFIVMGYMSPTEHNLSPVLSPLLLLAAIGVPLFVLGRRGLRATGGSKGIAAAAAAVAGIIVLYTGSALNQP